MLNTFPSLLTFGLLAPFIIRVVLALVFIHAGYLKIFERRESTVSLFENLKFPAPAVFVWVISLAEIFAGLFLLAGFGTQIAAIFIFIISLGGFAVKVYRGELLKQSVDFYIFAMVMSLSLVFSGAGFFAVDLPL
ncbi:MAG: DoxX family protein [Patescibacteria group bacterium]